MSPSNANANTDLAILSDEELARILARPDTGEDLAVQIAAEMDRRSNNLPVLVLFFLVYVSLFLLDRSNF